MPEIVIVAGPHGAGKTTFASEYIPASGKHLEFVNADEIARGLAPKAKSQQHADMRAARITLQRIDALAEARADFMFETTLASLIYARKIPVWRRTGYSVALLYLRLPSAEASMVRVKRRVEAGGHGIPEDVIRRRFAKSAAYLANTYKGIVSEWYIWDSLESTFTLAESWEKA